MRQYTQSGILWIILENGICDLLKYKTQNRRILTIMPPLQGFGCRKVTSCYHNIAPPGLIIRFMVSPGGVILLQDFDIIL